jgi:hypothetical protein
MDGSGQGDYVATVGPLIEDERVSVVSGAARTAGG